jgi:hypothetical protein
LSVADAVTVVVPETVAPAAGAVIDVDGSVVSPPPEPTSSSVKLRGRPAVATSFTP